MDKEIDKNKIKNEVKNTIKPITDDDFNLAFETDLSAQEKIFEEDIEVEKEKDCEFICAGCFLVYHKNQIGKVDGKKIYCKNCAEEL